MGRYQAGCASRKAIRDRLIRQNTTTWKAEANLASSMSGTKAISATMVRQVRAMLAAGVPVRLYMEASGAGANWLRAMANG